MAVNGAPAGRPRERTWISFAPLRSPFEQDRPGRVSALPANLALRDLVSNSASYRAGPSLNWMG
jgi:hypothetical protein